MNFIYQNIFINYSQWSRNAINKCILLDYECGSFYGEVTQLTFFDEVAIMVNGKVLLT
jgi:hypothetical protein